MKLNERSLAFYATCDSPADNAGFLFKKGERNTAYHRRWFVLKGNMLFYFEERESREPVGVIILEGCTVELCEAAEDFTFAIKFDCAKSRTYVLAAESQAAMESWVKSLSRASFDYLRLVVKELEKQLEEMQSGLAGSRSIQRRSPIYRKTKSALCLDTMSPALEVPPPRERPMVPPCAPLKENGCAVWNNVQCPDILPAGDVPGGLADSGSASVDQGKSFPALTRGSDACWSSTTAQEGHAWGSESMCHCLQTVSVMVGLSDSNWGKNRTEGGR
uniref:Sesquipedalian n=1 Tax=Terrapene triunguis TaxID=2587831 RepID=A0A674JKX0_9SAUR